MAKSRIADDGAFVEEPLTLDEYLAENEVNPGLVASFNYEAQFNPVTLQPKSKKGWDEAFAAQSNRYYQ